MRSDGWMDDMDNMDNMNSVYNMNRTLVMTVYLLLVILLSVTNLAYSAANCLGTDDFGTIGPSESTYDNTNSTMEISFDLKTSDVGNKFIISKRTSTGAGWEIGNGTGTLLVRIADASAGSAAERQSTVTINDGVARHFRVVMTTSTTVPGTNDINIYVNGVLNQGSITRTGNVYSPSSDSVFVCRKVNTYISQIIGNVKFMVGDSGLSTGLSMAQSKLLGLAMSGTRIGEFVIDGTVHGGALGTSGSQVTTPDRSGHGTTIVWDDGANNINMTSDLITFGPMYQRGVE
jgi:hypothetical protein